MPKRGKSLTVEQNERLRGIVRGLVDNEFSGNVTAAAQAFGVTQPLVSAFLGGSVGAGPKLINGLADYTGRSIDDLYGRPALPIASSTLALLGNHREWPAKSAEAVERRPRHLTPADVLRPAGVAMTKAPEHLTVEFILRMAEALMYAEPVGSDDL